MASQTKSLVVNVTTTNTWTQMLDEETAAAYTVPVGGRADLRALMASNLDSDSGVIDFAISDNGTITDVERGLPSATLAAGEYALWDSVLVIPTGKGVWVRVTGTTPNTTFRASILEVT